MEAEYLKLITIFLIVHVYYLYIKDVQESDVSIGFKDIKLVSKLEFSGGKKWVPSFPIRQPDQIVSVKAKMNSFFPSYEREKQIKINWLLSNEYQRIWFSEKAKYDLLNYPIKDTKRQRMENSSPPFVIKKRPTITGKVMVNRTRPPYRPELND